MLPHREILPQPRPHRFDGIEVAAVRGEPHLDEAVLLVRGWTQQEPFVIVPDRGLLCPLLWGPRLYGVPRQDAARSREGVYDPLRDPA